MHELATILVLTLGAGGAQSRPAWLQEAEIQAVARAAVPQGTLASPAPLGEARPTPPCSGDVCQPQVALPGYAPRFRARTVRPQLAVKALDAAGLEPAATLAWWFAGTGLRFERTSAAMDAAFNGGAVGMGYFQLVMSHRIDAFGEVTVLQRGR